MPRIQEMLDKIPTPLSGATCNEKSGWLPAGFDDQCREILTGIVKGLLDAQRKDDSIVDEFEVSTAKYVVLYYILICFRWNLSEFRLISFLFAC